MSQAVAGLVAACVLAAAVLTGFAWANRHGSAPQAATVPTATVPTATVANPFFTARVSVTSHASWDEVNLSCTYKSERSIPGNYVAIAEDAAGRKEVVASWPVIAGQTAEVHTPTTFRTGTITTVSILDGRGDTLVKIAV